ncbi:MAG: polysaccharide deacetylase family protein [Desulfocapsa sp.]|nr:polysaccharide deacetylase family protein [Desulfocapsa sp.]
MISALYKKLPQDSAPQLEQAIDSGLARGTGKAQIFFRADDIGVPGKQFSQLIHLFLSHQLPLCLAVVPTWLTTARFQTLEELTGKPSSQWCWYQHGWRHRNHESSGKKQEFGSGRPAVQQLADLKKGKERLLDIMGDSFAPFFTPPWNRCSHDTLRGLQDLNFLAISRSRNAQPASPPSLPDVQVNIDLHTRRESDPEESFQAFLKELEQGIAGGRGGIMIHHQRMNQAAFDFLALLLAIVASRPELHPVRFQEIVSDHPSRK